MTHIILYKEINFIAKTFQVLPFFLEVVHCFFDECLRRIPKHLHELPRLLSCHDKDAMTVKTQKLEAQGPCAGHRSIISILHCFSLVH